VANLNALKTLMPVFGEMKLAEIEATQIEVHLRSRLNQRKRVRRKSGVVLLGTLKPTTVHQEFRILRRIFSVAVKKKLCPSNPCDGVEFPVMVKSLFRPNYMSWSEQEKIEAAAPPYLRNIIRIVTETGLRVYKELAPLRKHQVDLANGLVFITDSKTLTGVADIPLTERAAGAFRDQMNIAGPGPLLFPSPSSPTGFQLNFKKAWRTALQKAGIPLLPALRLALHVRDPPQFRRSGRRMGDTAPQAI